MINLMINFFKIKLIFERPQKKKILLYDGETEVYLKKIYKHYSIYYNRWEQINLYVLIYTLFKQGIFNLKINYKLNYFNFVSPKLIISFIDNLNFFDLPQLYNKATYISVQTLLREKLYYDEIRKRFLENKKKKFKIDYLFVFSKAEEKILKNYFDSNFFTVGNYRNNYYFNGLNFKKKDKKKIIFITTFRLIYAKQSKLLNKRFNHFIRSFNLLSLICRDLGLDLYLLSKEGIEKKKEYKKIFNNINWTYIPKVSEENTYKIINNSNFLLSDNSTLLYEALGKYKKVLFLPSSYDFKSNYELYKKMDNLIYLKELNYELLKKRLLKILNINQDTWNKKIFKSIKYLMCYDPNNIKLKKTIFRYIN